MKPHPMRSFMERLSVDREEEGGGNYEFMTSTSGQGTAFSHFLVRVAEDRERCRSLITDDSIVTP